MIDLLDPSFLPAQPVNSGPEETGSGTLSSLSDAKAPDQADNEANPLPRTTVGEWKAGASSTSPEDGSWEDPASSAGDDLGRPFEGIENSNNPFFTMQDANAWDKTPNISSYTDGLIRKKNARFHIPPERNLNNIDELISLAQDEEEKKELKQQKRLLRNRRAAYVIFSFAVIRRRIAKLPK